MKRRDFIQNSSLGLVAASSSLVNPFSILKNEKKIRIGMIGIGARGMGHVGLLLKRNDVVITAICDTDPQRVEQATQDIINAGYPKPKAFGKNDYDYRNLLELKDVDAVIISTPWVWHTPMSIDSMNAGKPTACEVAGAFSVKECWDVVETYENTRTPYFVMENVAYRRDVMAALNMVRKGLFGEIVHLQGGYQHDLRAVKFNNGKQLYGGGVEFGKDAYSEAKWRTQHSVNRNGDLYPTHGLGPVGNMININRGNRLVSISSMSSKSAGLNSYITNHKKGGKDHKNASIEFMLGDIVTSMIKCANGESLVITHDTSLPRPYSLGFRVQGTHGIWMDVNRSIHIEGKSEPHEWENQEKYFSKYDHPLWKKYEADSKGAGHGGMDFFVLHAFIEALKNSEPMPLDVYDMACWSVVTPLSEESIAHGGKPISFPDFTSGRWISREPIFALDDRY